MLVSSEMIFIHDNRGICYWFKISTCDLYPDKTTAIFLFTPAHARPASGKSQKVYFLGLLEWTKKITEPFLNLQCEPFSLKNKIKYT